MSSSWRFADAAMFTSHLFRPVSFGFEDSRMSELRRRVLERVNSDQRFVWYILQKYGTPNGEPFFQDLCRKERELQAQIDQHLAERERAGRFRPRPGQTPAEQGPSSKPSPVPLVIEEVPELEFLPWIQAAASRSRGLK
jgi:hypothetical protein